MTVNGRVQAQFLAPRSAKFIEQGFMAARIILMRRRQGRLQVLLHRRNEVPQRGTWAAPGGKILFGDPVNDAAMAYMQYQTGMVCRVQHQGLVHYLDHHGGSIVQDKYFLIFHASSPQHDLLRYGPRGANDWIDYDYLMTGEDVIGGLAEMVDIALGDTFQFRERHFTVVTF